MKRLRFLMIGGFLGAGKTTAIARIARHYMQRGLEVGLVTNDQAYNLVDTQSLRAQGFQVGEVPGACFCCKFDDLIATVMSLQDDRQPDLIIAEPVGSCTDLVATVIEPMRHLYGGQFELGPLAVLLKPEHGKKILREEQGVGFSPKAAYIFLKQIEEADIVVINKIDKLSASERDELVRLVNERYPKKTVLTASARLGDGIDVMIERLESLTSPQHAPMDVDYQLYAQGEAELGWLNCQVHLRGSDGREFVLDEILLRLVSQLRDAMQDAGGEAAHVKVMGQSADQSAVANLVGNESEAELSLESCAKVQQADVLVNARVAIAPEQLESLVTSSIHRVAEQFQLAHSISGMQRFRPSPPVPTHRW